MALVQIMTTVEFEDQANNMAKVLLQRRVAACVQVLGPLKSTYYWKGNIEESTEWLLLIKTTERKVDQAMATLRLLHPYEVPEILVLTVASADAEYEKWAQEYLEDA